jgi:hypothetical protein
VLFIRVDKVFTNNRKITDECCSKFINSSSHLHLLQWWHGVRNQIPASNKKVSCILDRAQYLMIFMTLTAIYSENPSKT